MKSTKVEARESSGARTQEAGQYPVGGEVRAEAASANHLRTKAQAMCDNTLMEAAMDRDNLKGAYQRVMGNKGAAGVDGIGIEAFAEHLKRHWPTIKAKVLAGTYIPSPVRRVDIPKPQGGVRTLGIPTLTDRMIQQALHQVLQPIFEAEFSASSYGFRPGVMRHPKHGFCDSIRCAHCAQNDGVLWAYRKENSMPGPEVCAANFGGVHAQHDHAS
ncbi:MAG: hypothetical protein WCD66_11185 [Rhodanobacteraceae bacterium]